MTTDPGPLVIEVVRGREVESRHLVDVAVVDAAGSLVTRRGDAERGVLPRSSLKPVQALPLAASGAVITDVELAIACASHGGEPQHVAVVEDWLSAHGLAVGALECGAHAPFHQPSADALVREGRPFDARHNNCSGKHAGFLHLCRELGVDPSGYIGPEHPLQRGHVTPAVESMCGLSLATQTPGIDGCGIPVWAIPLDRLAAGWAALAHEEHGRRILGAMVAHPQLVAGTGRACTRLIEAGGGRVVAKTGAEGVYCALDLESGHAIALKTCDGAGRAAELAVEWMLGELGALPVPVPVVLRNWAGVVVGELRVVP